MSRVVDSKRSPHKYPFFKAEEKKKKQTDVEECAGTSQRKAAFKTEAGSCSFAAAMLRAQARWLPIAISGFNVIVGSLAVLRPRAFGRALESDPRDPAPWIRRTGMLWLYFAGVAWHARRSRPHQRLLAQLHLMDALADGWFRLTTRPLSRLGKWSFGIMPALNLLVFNFLSQEARKAPAYA